MGLSCLFGGGGGNWAFRQASLKRGGRFLGSLKSSITVALEGGAIYPLFFWPIVFTKKFIVCFVLEIKFCVLKQLEAILLKNIFLTATSLESGHKGKTLNKNTELSVDFKQSKVLILLV